jgi:PAS domain S-box-containing protein
VTSSLTVRLRNGSATGPREKRGRPRRAAASITIREEFPALPPTCDSAASLGFQVWWEWDLASDQLTVLEEPSATPAELANALPGTGAAWEAAIHPDDLPRVRAARKGGLAGPDGRWCCEHRVQGQDGGWHWVLTAGRVDRRDGDGRPTHLLGVTVGLADRLRKEEIRNRDAQMLASVKQSIVCTDLEGIVTYWSCGATELYGWTAQEMLGRAFWERMPTEDMRAHARLRMHTAATRGEFRHERADFRKDGSPIFVDSHVFPFRDPAGNVIGVIGTAHDITARRQAELDRLQLERQLLQAQKLETVGTLAGGVAHEFNNLLATIIGNTQLAMLANPEDRTAKEFHESILQSSWRARDLVKGLLSYSRSHEPERRPVRPAQVLAEAARLIRMTLPATVELEVDPAPGAPEIQADANQLQQVLLNLAANAGYAMGEQGGRLTLRARPAQFAGPHPCSEATLPAGIYLALEVADTGQGIEAHHLPRIFDPFFTTKPVGEGSGLGLSIVRSIVAGHGGGVEVSSARGVGTTFKLYLPVAAAKILPEPKPADPPGPLAPARSPGERVVVIDDEATIAEVLAQALDQLGYAVQRFGSADEFYARFSAEPFPVDLLLTDQTMPRLTGIQLAQRLRAEGRSFPIVILSGHSKELTPDALRALGPVSTLDKPFDLARLTAVVQRLLHPR